MHKNYKTKHRQNRAKFSRYGRLGQNIRRLAFCGLAPALKKAKSNVYVSMWNISKFWNMSRNREISIQNRNKHKKQLYISNIGKLKFLYKSMQKTSNIGI